MSSAIRVGFDARWYNDSGVGTYVAELLRALAPLQTDVHLVVYEGAGNPVPGLERLPLERIPVDAGKYSLGGMREMARRCRDDRLDVFHSPFYPSPLNAPCPVVATIHDLIPFLFPIYAWPKRQMVKAGYRRAARVASQVITGSAHTSCDVERILKVNPDKVTTIAYAVSAAEFRSEGNASELKLLWDKYGLKQPYAVAASARNWRTKNLESALRALQAVGEISGVKFQTAVYGVRDGLDAAGGETRWPQLNLLRVGYVSATELAMLYRHAELFIMPSLYEGFGLPVVEAMACGCPVITSNGGALAEVAGQGAQVFRPMDVEGMAAAAAALMTSPAVHDRWRQAALRRAAEFSWNRAAMETIAVYHRAYRDGSSGKCA
jgi:glycosyltransferase involved in cell wall biosynthesis